MDGATSGKLLIIVLASAALAAVAALVIARRHRVAMKRLMGLPAPAASSVPAVARPHGPCRPGP